MNCTACNIMVLTLLERYPEEVYLGQMEFLVFFKNHHIDFHNACTSLHSANNIKSSFFPPTLSAFVVFEFLMIIILLGIRQKCHCCFDWHCHNGSRRWTIFHVPIGHLYFFFWKDSIHFNCSFLIESFILRSFLSFAFSRQ